MAKYNLVQLNFEAVATVQLSYKVKLTCQVHTCCSRVSHASSRENALATHKYNCGYHK